MELLSKPLFINLIMILYTTFIARVNFISIQIKHTHFKYLKIEEIIYIWKRIY